MKPQKYKTFKGIIQKYSCPFCGNRSKEYGKAVFYRCSSINAFKPYYICEKCKKEWYEEELTIITKIVEKKDDTSGTTKKD
jgi:transposase-like protein